MYIIYWYTACWLLLYFIQQVDAFEIIHELTESIVDIDESVIMGEIADYRTKQKIFRKHLSGVQ